MHAILFQMALIPITMSRFSIAALGDTFLNRIVPLNRSLGMHIHLGYTMVLIIFIATAFFFFFFGILCAEGEQGFCDKFTMEIMITGYVIFAFLIVVGVTSFYRHSIPYELFYYIHHVVFLLYILTIAHTLDVEQRSGRSSRSQTFKWFTSTLLYYVCDRAAMHLNHKYTTKMMGSSVVWGSNGSKLVILKVLRPILFQFKPGQYAFIRIGSIDNHWHPFSIASRPDSPYMEFYIEVVDNKKSSTWTKQLWYMVKCECDNNSNDKYNGFNLTVDLMGPYGTSLDGNQKFSHMLAIGAGTGIVPILSSYKEHMHSLFRLDPSKYFSELKSSETIARQIELAEDSRKGSLAQKLGRFLMCCCQKGGNENQNDTSSPRMSRRDTLSKSIRRSIVQHDALQTKKQMRMNTRDLKKNAGKATQSIYGTILLSLLPVVGMSLFALMISWSTIPIDLYPMMVQILKMFTVAFQGCFAIASLFFWNVDGILAYVDFVFVLVSPFADWYWTLVCEENGRLPPNNLVMYSLLIWYMIIRLWIKAVGPAQSSWFCAVNPVRTTTKFDKLSLLWTTRSASQVSEILPDILEPWNLLVKKWGADNARQVCEVTIYVTDPDDAAYALLRKEFEHTDFYKMGGIRHGRADVKKVIEDHTIELMHTRYNPRSLLAFCGSPSLAKAVHYDKISNDMISAMTGNCQSHVMEFTSESYGGAKSKKKKEAESSSQEVFAWLEGDAKSHHDDYDMELLTNRKTVVMDNYASVELVDSSVESSWI
jgi:predicted ferric reductase